MSENNRPLHPRLQIKLDGLERLSDLEYRRDDLQEKLSRLQAELAGVEHQLEKVNSEFQGVSQNSKYMPQS